MTWLHDHRLVGQAIDLWRRYHRGRPRLSTVRWFPSVGHVPDVVPRHVVAVAGDPPSWLMFECPCGAGHRVMVRMKPHHRVPHWRLVDPVRPTLHPSIDFMENGKRCHFWLRDGRVQWV